MKQLKAKVLWCLEHDEESRNSDVRLTNCIYVNYYMDKLIKVDGKLAVMLTSLYELPKEEDVRRIRAAIQNDKKHGRFLPTNEKIRYKRKISEERWRSFLGYNPELRTVE